MVHHGFVKCKIRALCRHKSLLPNSAGWWRVGQLQGVVCGLWICWIKRLLLSTVNSIKSFQIRSYFLHFCGLMPAQVFLFWEQIVLRVDPEVFKVLCWSSSSWTIAFQTCTRCLTPASEAIQCREVGNIACTRAKGPAMATVSLSRFIIHPAWSRLGPPASTTRVPTLLVLLFLRVSFAAWRSLSVTSTSPSTFPRSNLNFHTCGGCRVRTGKVWHAGCDYLAL